MEILNKGSKIQSNSVRDLCFVADRLIKLLFFAMAVMVGYLKPCRLTVYRTRTLLFYGLLALY